MPSVPYHNHDLHYYRRSEVDYRLSLRAAIFHGHPMAVDDRQSIAAGYCMVLDTLEIADGGELIIADGASVVLVG